MKKLILFIATLLISSFSFGQGNVTYQKPPKEILDLVDVPLPPSVELDDKGEYMVLFFRDTYKSIAELSEKEMRLGGLRINPVTNISSRQSYNNNIKVKKVKDKKTTQVSGLPDNPRLANFSWSRATAA